MGPDVQALGRRETICHGHIDRRLGWVRSSQRAVRGESLGGGAPPGCPLRRFVRLHARRAISRHRFRNKSRKCSTWKSRPTACHWYPRAPSGPAELSSGGSVCQPAPPVLEQQRAVTSRACGQAQLFGSSQLGKCFLFKCLVFLPTRH